MHVAHGLVHPLANTSIIWFREVTTVTEAVFDPLVLVASFPELSEFLLSDELVLVFESEVVVVEEGGIC